MASLVTSLNIYDFLTKKYPKVRYCIEGLVPLASTILLHGKWGVGKSPLTWAMAFSVAQGSPFLGLNTVQGSVIYIEADTPEVVFYDRMVKGVVPKRIPIEFIFPQTFDCLAWGFKDGEIFRKLCDAQDRFTHSLVIINTV